MIMFLCSYIGNLETLAAQAAYSTFPDILLDTMAMHFIDNQGALGVLAKGSSTDLSLTNMAHACAMDQLHLRCRVWFEYVRSAANIADLPSRHALLQAASLLRERFHLSVHARPLKLPHIVAYSGRV